MLSLGLPARGVGTPGNCLAAIHWVSVLEQTQVYQPDGDFRKKLTHHFKLISRKPSWGEPVGIQQSDLLWINITKLSITKGMFKMFGWFRIYSFLALCFDDGSFNITDWLLPLAREISDFNFFIGRSYCAAFPGFYGKQASEIKAKPGTIWSMMSSTERGLKMSVGLNKAIRSECFQSYTGPRSLTSKFNQCRCKCLLLQAGEAGIFFQAPVMHAHQVMYSAKKLFALCWNSEWRQFLCFCCPCDCSGPITFSGLVSLSQTAHPDWPSPFLQGWLSLPHPWPCSSSIRAHQGCLWAIP